MGLTEFQRCPLRTVGQDLRPRQGLAVRLVNAEGAAPAAQSGETWFWSRSRQELWHKGETSGNVQRVMELRLDCDEDAILALVEPAGPACHTGERTCFHKGDLEPVAAEALARSEEHTSELQSRQY